jgi:L,D-peptidoglycan transpeptidase YkuD (ErfK/YbiS/YcfS/YnhG family)
MMPRRLQIPILRRLAALVILGLSIFGCEDAPVGSLERAKLALVQASTAQATRYAIQTYRQAESLVQSGWMEMARQNGRLAPLRDYRVADSVLMVATQLAESAATRAKDSLTRARANVMEVQDTLKEELTHWEEAIEGSLYRNRLEEYWDRAKISHDMSRRLYVSGEYDEALQSVNKGRSQLSTLGVVFADLSNHEPEKLQLWRRWVRETVDESRMNGTYAIIVDKSAHKTHLIKDGRIVRTYKSDLGRNPGHQKMLSGDGATPEGRYLITQVRHRGSKYYKALPINYPNDDDRARFERNKRSGVISRRARIGGYIEIHGHGARNEDWTEGCVALSNDDMDDIMKYTSVGTPVTIVRKSDRWP